MQTPTELDVLRRRVQQAIDVQIAGATESLAVIGDETAPLVAAVSSLLTGGKGLRARFLYWGYRAAGGADSDALVRLAASMEFFQGAALLHDDVMDRSDTRRGMPSAHRAVAVLHQQEGWAGDADRFGEGTAILAGDLCLTWCDELYSTCGLPAVELARGRRLFDTMRTQLMGGQFLDLLGVFGDPEATGKPAGDDLREGKRTVLVAHALDAASADERATVERLLGRDDLDLSGVEQIRRILMSTGAVDRVEALIATLADDARKAVGQARETGAFDPDALDVLEDLVDVSTARHS